MAGTDHALACVMDAAPGDDVESKRLVVTSRHLVDAARARIQFSMRRLDRARNALQVSWVRREIRQRRARRGS
jgi:hypothetical protein